MPRLRKAVTPEAKPASRPTASRKGATRRVEPEHEGSTKTTRRFSGVKNVSKGLTRIPWPLLSLVLICGLVGYGVVSLGKSFYLYLDQPLIQVQVEGETRYVDVAALKSQILSQGKQGFVSSNMDHIRTEIEAFGWVKSAKLKRFWPYGLKVELDEHQPVARWGDQALLSAEGDVFEVPEQQAFTKLPKLTGIAGQELEMMAIYSDLNRQLWSLGLSIEHLHQSARGAWELVCNSGLKINLGKDQIQQKMSKFVKVYQLSLAKDIEKIEQVDLRYTNGLAVAWKAEEKVSDGEQKIGT